MTEMHRLECYRKPSVKRKIKTFQAIKRARKMAALLA
jgi:ribosomal protein S21